jgi:hypothetical protein
MQARRAQELGASALLIYNDVSDDGTVTPEQGYEPYGFLAHQSQSQNELHYTGIQKARHATLPLYNVAQSTSRL